tara:strand:- start:303 stop:977 length:675 start_codon:yes stop_codon:yes gene_type:complete
MDYDMFESLFGKKKSPKRKGKSPKRKKKSPKRKGVLSDRKLRKLAKENGVDVYKVVKGRNRLVSRSTLLKRLREAGLGLREKKPKFVNPNVPLSEQEEEPRFVNPNVPLSEQEESPDPDSDSEEDDSVTLENNQPGNLPSDKTLGDDLDFGRYVRKNPPMVGRYAKKPERKHTTSVGKVVVKGRKKNLYKGSNGGLFYKSKGRKVYVKSKGSKLKPKRGRKLKR